MVLLAGWLVGWLAAEWLTCWLAAGWLGWMGWLGWLSWLGSMGWRFKIHRGLIMYIPCWISTIESLKTKKEKDPEISADLLSIFLLR